MSSAVEGLGGGKNSLFITITIWVGLAIFAFLLVASLLGHTPIWNLKLTDQESIVKTALTLVGGVGAVAYLVIKYQERQQAKRDEERASREETREKDRLINTKMQDAVNQLGSDKVSTRIAGVYALTDIADTYRGRYRQRVVDILCGYLRSDRTSYALDEFGNTVKDEFGRLVKSGSSDEAVESTILDMFAVHLRKERRSREDEVTVRQQVEDDQLWCDCRFDFHGTAFHGVVSFADFMFENETGFSDVIFEGTADFSNATFKDKADFHGAKFACEVSFFSAMFTDVADLSSATFTDVAEFHGATFTDVAKFHGATFTDMADFSYTTFYEAADFYSLNLSKPKDIDFGGAKFNRKYCNAPHIYAWGPISIPPDNDGLPSGAEWAELEENS